MVNINHATITDPYIHEPKGVRNAPANYVYIADGTGSGSWRGLPSADVTLVSTRVGSVINYPGNTPPSKWFLCYGQQISRTTYSALFDVIGTTYGAGNGSTTFNLPDCRGRVIAGKDNMGGLSADRLTDQLNGDILGAAGGSQSSTLIAKHIPTLTGTAELGGNHTHGLSNSSVIVRAAPSSLGLVNSSDIYKDARYSITSNITVNSAGNHTHNVTVNANGNSPHNNVQPTIIMNKIIYHGVA